MRRNKDAAATSSDAKEGGDVERGRGGEKDGVGGWGVWRKGEIEQIAPLGTGCRWRRPESLCLPLATSVFPRAAAKMKLALAAPAGAFL